MREKSTPVLGPTYLIAYIQIAVTLSHNARIVRSLRGSVREFKVSDPDGNDGLLPGRVGHRAPVAEIDAGQKRPSDGAKRPESVATPGKRRRRRRRARKNRLADSVLPTDSGLPVDPGLKGSSNTSSAKNGAANPNHKHSLKPAGELNRSAAKQGNIENKIGQPAEGGQSPNDGKPSRPQKHADGKPQGPNGNRPSRPGSSTENKSAGSKYSGSRHKGQKHNGYRQKNRHPMRRSGQDLYAALDLGTNNCRLLIAEPRDKGFKVVDAFSRIVRLGEGMTQNGTLRLDAMERAIDALRVCRKKLDNRGVKKVRLVATEACRSAGNGQLFLDRVRDEANLDLEVLSRGGEAKLAVIGCSPLIDDRDDGALLFDIGGGSSEIAWIDLKKRHRDKNASMTDCILNWTSLPVGVVTLSEKFGGVDVTPEVFQEMIDYVDGLLDEAGGWGLLTKAISNGKAHFIGTSGTVTTIAGVHLELDRYDRRLVDGIWLNDGKINDVMKMMLAMTYVERVDNACIGRDRADLVLGGCAILEAIRRRWPCKRLRVADRGLREGILLEMMMADGVWNRDRPNVRL